MNNIKLINMSEDNLNKLAIEIIDKIDYYARDYDNLSYGLPRNDREMDDQVNIIKSLIGTYINDNLSVSNLSLPEMEWLIDDLMEARNKKFDEMYIEVNIHPGEVITEKIKAETGFDCYHKEPKIYTSGRGTHVIVIPRDQFSPTLKNMLISKYDDKW